MVPANGRSIAAPAQHKQPSRKGKKAWRKNVDVSDVQTGLEEVREELIKGGIIKEQPSDSLFTIDPSGSAAIQRSYNKIHKPLKADEILAQRSAIEKVATHKRPHGTTDGVVESSSKKRKTDGVSPQEYERLRQVAYHGQQMKEYTLKSSSQDKQSYDPWAVDPTADKIDPRFDYLEKEKPIVAPRTLKEAPISLLIQSGKKGPTLPAVRKPKAGTSYNPLFEDWSTLLKGEGEKAIVAERKRLLEAKAETQRLQRIAAASEEVERAEGWQTEEESAWEGFESDYEGEGLGLERKKRSERKTPQERRKVERRKENERKEKAVRKEKEKAIGEKRILAIKKQVEAEAKQRSLSLASGNEEDKSRAVDDGDDDDAEDEVLRKRKLGKDVLPSAPLELVLPDELQDSLRLLKPEGNLLKERFRSYMLRGKVETRPKPIQQAKKRRTTLTEKWTYKDFKVGT